MKTRQYFSILILLFCIQLFASPVDLHQAEKVAIHFYCAQYNQYEGLVTLNQIKVLSVNTEADEIHSYYYVFHFNKGGFVIVAADDRLTPVLGYSLDQSFEIDHGNTNLQWWMDQYKGQVKYACEQQLQATEKVNRLWQQYTEYDGAPSMTKTKTDQVGPLITSLWDQGLPFNLICPEDPQGPGGHALTGCVATAYAQMLYYWRFPIHGSGYHCYTPASHPEYGEQCADFENTWYQWDEMCDDPLTPNMAIAELMYQVGVALEMDYGPAASGAMGYPEQMETWFRISTDYDSLRRDFYTNEEWVNIIMDQLNQHYPVGYIGFTPNMSSGHMWICDGYQDSTYYHMNWGWGGSSNGYYTLDNLQGFNTYQFIGINFYPDMVNNTYPNCAAGPDTLTAFEGSICDGSGPVFDYLDNTEASWLIDPQTAFDSVTSIVLQIIQLDLINDGDVLMVYDGPDNSSPLLAEITGNMPPDDILSSGNQLYIEFTTNGTGTAQGFYLNYRTNRPVWCSGMTSLTGPFSTFDDGSGSFYYNNSTTCTWIIDPGISDPLTLHFNHFDTEADHDLVKIYDGISQELITTLSGYFEEPPGPVTSPSGKMMVAFMSSQNVQRQGWEAWYDVNTGTADVKDEMSLSIIPNPTNSWIKIDFTLLKEEMVTVEILNVVGESERMISNVKRAAGSHSISADLTPWPIGIYFCRVQIGNERITKKIIKTN
ncbi:MAG: C10 family peptidase [Bacteroidetes bacterium]|nr:C10 family peptidase [Bacteroidota bacterium]